MNTLNKHSWVESLAYIIIIFQFTHGFLYFFSGSELYDASSPIKLVKYILVISLITVFFVKDKANINVLFILIIAIIFFILSATINIYFGFDLQPLLIFLFPFFLVITCQVMKEEKFIGILAITMLVAFIFLFVEFFFFQDVSKRFNQTGFRAVSIFVNPNSFGVMMVLSLSIVWNKLDVFKKSILLIITTLSVLLSGSKTAMLIFGIFCLFYLVFNIKSLLLMVFISISSVLLVSLNPGLLELIQLRELSLVSGQIRLLEAEHFFVAANECIFVPLDCDKTIYLDNAFIISWINFGILGLIFSVVLFIISAYVSWLKLRTGEKEVAIFFLLFWVSSFTTNVLNIWPISYLFWVIMGYSIINNKMLISLNR